MLERWSPQATASCGKGPLVTEQSDVRRRSHLALAVFHLSGALALARIVNPRQESALVEAAGVPPEPSTQPRHLSQTRCRTPASAQDRANMFGRRSIQPTTANRRPRVRFAESVRRVRLPDLPPRKLPADRSPADAGQANDNRSPAAHEAGCPAKLNTGRNLSREPFKIPARSEGKSVRLQSPLPLGEGRVRATTLPNWFSLTSQYRPSLVRNTRPHIIMNNRKCRNC